MKQQILVTTIMAIHAASLSLAETDSAKSKTFAQIQAYVDARIAEFETIPPERLTALKEFASYICDRRKSGQAIRLTFICTHNSRRSHLSQIWASIAAHTFDIANVETFSGGTEATAFNPRAIAALERIGLKFRKLESDDRNPKYEVHFSDSVRPLICFSKVYCDPPNPKTDFCAVMTCDQADQSCPLVRGSAFRVALRFEDPKIADDTPEETSKYDERCRQISREMLYLFAQVRESSAQVDKP